MEHSYLGTLVYRAAILREMDATWSLFSTALSLPSPFFMGADRTFQPILLDVTVPLRLEHLLFDLRTFFDEVLSFLYV